jgi:hypothetical protein
LIHIKIALILCLLHYIYGAVGNGILYVT